MKIHNTYQEALEKLNTEVLTPAIRKFLTAINNKTCTLADIDETVLDWLKKVGDPVNTGSVHSFGEINKTSKAAIELLDAIEEVEMRSLSWGYPHGSLSYDEIEEIFNNSTVSGLDCDELVEELIEARLIFLLKILF